jgi:hypothetical protein
MVEGAGSVDDQEQVVPVGTEDGRSEDVHKTTVSSLLWVASAK